ncbi:hypothetical protein [Kitasatospora griseola]|uniref:hypothetical protein n=1 Tax=Kitasatospora griseola TaxID=2064 RepID=UPI0038112290
MSSPQSETKLLHATASALDAQRDKLPRVHAPFRLPEPIAVGRQITELGRSITELGNEYLIRAAAPAPQEHTVLTAAFGNAVGGVAQAASALGTVAQQLAFIAHSADRRGEPGCEGEHTRAGQLVECAVETARDDLAEASQALRDAATTVSPAPAPLRQAALARSPSAATRNSSPSAMTAPTSPARPALARAR